MSAPALRARSSRQSVRTINSRGVALAAVCACAGASHAQWDIWNLSPPAFNDSWVTSVRGGLAAGSVLSGGLSQGGYWTGQNGSSFVSLHPVGATTSGVQGSSPNFQVGVAQIGGQYRASRWSGSAASWLDLSPVGATSSYAYGMDGDHPVGVARFGASQGHASLWTGGPETWTDLSPAGSTTSAAFGGGGGQQAGYADFAGEWNAVYWTGSAESFVNLHPAGATNSWANNSDGAQQVGQYYTGTETHAALWSGSAASFVDLHVAGFGTSVAYDVWGGWQVGYVSNGGDSRASLWNGSAESWIDLGDELAPWFGRSSAQAIWSDGTTLYIGGFADNEVAGGTDAIVWTRTIPSPGGLALLGLGGILGGKRRRGTGARSGSTA